MATVEKVTIALTAEQAGFVRDVVASGAYASTSDRGHWPRYAASHALSEVGLGTLPTLS